MAVRFPTRLDLHPFLMFCLTHFWIWAQPVARLCVQYGMWQKQRTFSEGVQGGILIIYPLPISLFPMWEFTFLWKAHKVEYFIYPLPIFLFFSSFIYFFKSETPKPCFFFQIHLCMIPIFTEHHRICNLCLSQRVHIDLLQPDVTFKAPTFQ